MQKFKMLLVKLFSCWILLAISLDIISGHGMVVVILSQPNSYHAHKAQLLREELLRQAEDLNNTSTSVVLLHEWTDHPGAWTILPILTKLYEEYSKERSSFLFCEENVVINLQALHSKLDKYDLTEELFLGRALRDKEATIIHHFAFHNNVESFSYPDFSSCFLMSSPLVNSLVERLQNSPPASDFSIDVQHELALYIYDKVKGISLTGVNFFCGYKEKNRKNCATYTETKLPSCGEIVDENKVLFAVKTCEKYHHSRVSVLKKTWGKHAKHIQYFSDKEDSSIPTITLGVPNTEKGHCAKCLAILRYIYNHQAQNQYDWIVIVDDDTLMSVTRLRKLLSCYHPTDAVALGERYGYAVDKNGYNYITLGGGMVLSRVMLSDLVKDESCRCGSDDSPDDMTLGMCIRRLNLHITHSALFHQARPDDYSLDYLTNQGPVSFHRHWMIDPVAVYNTWLADDDVTHDDGDDDDVADDKEFNDKTEENYENSDSMHEEL